MVFRAFVAWQLAIIAWASVRMVPPSTDGVGLAEVLAPLTALVIGVTTTVLALEAYAALRRASEDESHSGR